MGVALFLPAVYALSIMEKLKTAAAAEHLGLTLRSFYNIRAEGRGPKQDSVATHRRGQPILFLVDELDRWQVERDLVKALRSFNWRTLPFKKLQRAAGVAGIELVT